MTAGKCLWGTSQLKDIERGVGYKTLFKEL